VSNPQQDMQRARAALGAGDPRAAARLLQKVLTDNPRDVEARYLHGRCLAAQARWRDAASEFRRVLSARSGFLPAMVDLGIADAFDGNYQAAQALLEEASAIDSRPAELHFGLGLSRLGLGDSLGAARAFEEAIARNPQFPDAYNNLGVAYDRLGQLTEAAQCFRQAVAIYGDFADAHRNLGDALLRLSDVPGAVAAFHRAAQLRPADASAHAELGAAQLAAGDYASAASSLEKALQLDRTLVGATANLGEVLRNSQAPERAETLFQRALDLDPNLGEAHLGLGKLAMARGDTAAAVRCLLAAADNMRTDAKTALFVAAALEELGRSGEALSVLQAAAIAQSGNAELHDAVGALLHRLGRLAEALDSYERALEVDDERVETLVNCGHALESMGALARAITCFERVLTLRPADARSVASIASCAFRLCDWELAERMLAKLRELPHGIDELQSFLMLAADLGPADIAGSLQRRFHTKSWPATPPTLHVSQGRAKDRLRVAYVSPDFRIHPVAYALAGIIERHDRDRITPIAVSLRTPDGSAIGSRLKHSFEEYLDVSAIGDRNVVALMHERGIDVAVDVAGLTSGARTGIFAMRAAPVQVNYLGFPGSMGMPFMDFIIADQVVLPESDDIYYSEKVLRMPNSYLPFDDSRILPHAGSGREAAALPEHGFVFCAFNNGYKITRPLFELWMDLLREVPGSILWLRSMGPETAATLKKAARKLGVAVDRLVFAAFAGEMDQHLSRLQLADLFLDTLPYNAHTTATEALWAGVPVITCLGKTLAGRVGASLLTAAGLPELICPDLASYRALALGLARSPARLARCREQLQQGRSSAPLFDTARYTRDFEALLHDAVKRVAHPTRP
jgi:protein O-GlcNAc transferase